MNILFLLTLFSCRTDTTSTKEQTVVAQVEDKDQDGYSTEQDCNDGDATINPGAIEVCDGIDNNCNGAIDDDDELVTDRQTFYVDTDGDNYGVATETIEACALVADSTSCAVQLAAIVLPKRVVESKHAHEPGDRREGGGDGEDGDRERHGGRWRWRGRR